MNKETLKQLWIKTKTELDNEQGIKRGFHNADSNLWLSREEEWLREKIRFDTDNKWIKEKFKKDYCGNVGCFEYVMVGVLVWGIIFRYLMSS